MGSYKDLTGQKFHKLLVIQRVDDYVSPSGYHKTRWLCKCDCGNEVVVDGSRLTGKKSITRSCGCLHREINYIDYSGQQVNELYVIKQCEDYIAPSQHHSRQWLCKCSCGKELKVLDQWLKKGRYSCGHPENLVGRVFGSLTVLYRDEDLIEKNGKHRTAWFCECDCGETVTVEAHKLLSGNTKSCGHLRKQMYQDNTIDITNVLQTNGYLKGVKPIEPRFSEGGCKINMWLCECTRCGELTVASLNSFMTGNKKSCGCIRRSYGEALISDILNDEGITFETEYVFPDLKGNGKNPLRFDFAIYINTRLILIEYDGKQHYKPSWATADMTAEERYELQKQYDERKETYLQEHNIPLIRIPYKLNTYEGIKQFLDENIKKFLP